MTHQELLVNVAALLNDTARDQYTDTVLLAYYNMALMELEEEFELNNVATTNETSAVLDVVAGSTSITFPPDPVVAGVDYLPTDLVEIRNLWWSEDGQNDWDISDKRDFLTGSELGGSTQTSSVDVWAWIGNEVRILSASVDLDIKIDYTRKLFPLLVIGDLVDDLLVLNAASPLQFRTAGLCAEFIMENPTRANSLNGMAIRAKDISLGIKVKSQQSIVTRRRPFRAAYKRRRG